MRDIPDLPSNVFIQYVRDEDNNPTATFVAIPNGVSVKPYSIGFSICHPNDQFEKAQGRFIAYRRALAGKELPTNKHSRFNELYEAFLSFEDRVERALGVVPA